MAAGDNRVLASRRHGRDFPMNSLLVVALGVFPLVLTVYVAHPRIEILPEASLSGSSQVQFLIKNDGRFALLDVTAACLLDEVRYEDHVIETGDSIALARGAAVLAHGEATTIACTGFTRDLPIERADVTISIAFSAPFWPKHHLLLEQKFAGARSRSGTFHWWPSARKVRKQTSTAL
jgi:hypothetical protein